MSDTTTTKNIVKAPTAKTEPKYVIEVARKHESHPIRGTRANFVEVNFFHADLEGTADSVERLHPDVNLTATPTTNETTPKVVIAAVAWPSKAGDGTDYEKFSDNAIISILTTPLNFVEGSTLGHDTIRVNVHDGVDLDELKAELKGLHFALENGEIPISHITQQHRRHWYVRQPFNFLDWIVAYDFGNLAQRSKVRENRNSNFTLGNE